MKVVGFSGYSGSGKTTLVEKLIAVLRAQGARVSVVKHAHHRFDIDHPGKDTYRHREAGAFEVLIASRHRLALMREFEREAELSVHQLIAELDARVDWVLVEGYRDADLLKIEVWRPEVNEQAWYPQDPCVLAVATTAPQRLPEPTTLPVLPLSDAAAVARWMLDNQARFEYRSRHRPADLERGLAQAV